MTTKQMSSTLRCLLNFLNGFRKLTICVLTLALATTFLVTGHITGEIYGNVLTITVPAYFAGNIGEHMIDVAKTWIDNKTKD